MKVTTPSRVRRIGGILAGGLLRAWPSSPAPSARPAPRGAPPPGAHRSAAPGARAAAGPTVHRRRPAWPACPPTGRRTRSWARVAAAAGLSVGSHARLTLQSGPFTGGAALTVGVRPEQCGCSTPGTPSATGVILALDPAVIFEHGDGHGLMAPAPIPRERRQRQQRHPPDRPVGPNHQGCGRGQPSQRRRDPPGRPAGAPAGWTGSTPSHVRRAWRRYLRRRGLGHSRDEPGSARPHQQRRRHLHPVRRHRCRGQRRVRPAHNEQGRRDAAPCSSSNTFLRTLTNLGDLSLSGATLRAPRLDIQAARHYYVRPAAATSAADRSTSAADRWSPAGPSPGTCATPRWSGSTTRCHPPACQRHVHPDQRWHPRHGRRHDAGDLRGRDPAGQLPAGRRGGHPRRHAGSHGRPRGVAQRRRHVRPEHDARLDLTGRFQTVLPTFWWTSAATASCPFS